MCVAIACETAFPSKKVLKQCQEKNRDGGGVAWVENGVVKYVKGIGYRKIYKITKKIKPPALIHFRIATAGGVTPGLCHPFPIDGEASIELHGEADKVLCHNGHWRDWRETCLKMLVNRDLTFPKGPWSDSRAMAWISNKSGTPMLELLDEKIALLTGKKKLTLFGKGWTERNGIFYSNTHWEPWAGYSTTRSWNTYPYGNSSKSSKDLEVKQGVKDSPKGQDVQPYEKENRGVSCVNSNYNVNKGKEAVIDLDDEQYMQDVIDEIEERERQWAEGYPSGGNKANEEQEFPHLYN